MQGNIFAFWYILVAIQSLEMEVQWVVHVHLQQFYLPACSQ